MAHFGMLQEHKDMLRKNRCKNIKLHLEGDLYVITSDTQGLMYVGFHKFVGQEIIQGFNLTMDEWTEFLTVMESTTEEVNESQPNTLHYTLHELIHLSYIYILEREIIARAHYNCFGCEQEAPGQQDHMESGCISEDLVHQYYPEAVMAFSCEYLFHHVSINIKQFISNLIWDHSLDHLFLCGSLYPLIDI